MMFPVRSALRTDWYFWMQSLLVTAGSFRYCCRGFVGLLVPLSVAEEGFFAQQTFL